jgi:hypothetical protein
LPPHLDSRRAPARYLTVLLLVFAAGSIALWLRSAGRAGDLVFWTSDTGEAKTGVQSSSALRISPSKGPGGPILVLSSAAKPFTSYYGEILRAEGLNEFTVQDISLVDVKTLASYEVVILGEMPLTSSEADILNAWVRHGGNLIALRPDKHLASLLGLHQGEGHVEDGYLSINGNSLAGKGLVRDTIQFHGVADLYTSESSSGDETSNVATLFTDANTTANAPAVFLRKVGDGKAAVFAYDLARSVVYTRQGNPAWSGMERDGIPPMRTDDQFFGGASYDNQRDWVDLNKVEIPQADEQQRLLANLILEMNAEKTPLPRFWYFPRGLKAVVIMTGDDHGHGGTVGRFRLYQGESPAKCSLAEWQCVRATSYIFLGSITPEEAQTATQEGFEIGLHIYNHCADWPREASQEGGPETANEISLKALDSLYTEQLAAFHAIYPGVPAPVTNRIHCVPWGDFDAQPRIEAAHGIRLDMNYYYWPRQWVKDRPGMFTGSGIPMRFTTRDGSIIDIYQAATQMTDESGQTYPFTIERLLDNALGPREFYGAFTANMHTDQSWSSDAHSVVVSAQAKGIPVVTAAQMLAWLDGRNSSSFQELSWNSPELRFSITTAANADGLQALLPLQADGGELAQITMNDTPVAYQNRSFAGLNYAAFQARPGRYVARYGSQSAKLDGPRLPQEVVH